MSFKIADAFVEVTARTDKLNADIRRLERSVGPDAERSGSGVGARFMAGFLSNVRSPSSLKTFIGTLAGVTAGALAATPALISAGKWIGELAKSAGSASPALAAMGVIGAAAFGTLKMGLTGFSDALGKTDTPAGLKKVNEALAAMHPEARLVALSLRGLKPEFDGLTRSVQGAMFKNLADDVRSVGELLIVKAAPGMRGFSSAVNLVLADLLKWGGSLDGIRATEAITNSMHTGMSLLHPAISNVITSFGNMIGRIAEVSTAAGANGLSAVLDWLADRMDRVNAATVQVGLDGLKDKFIQVRDVIVTVISWVRQGIDFWTRYRVEIGLVQDGLALLAIAFAGPVVAAIAAAALIIRHWDDLKVAWQGTVDYFNSVPGHGFLTNMEIASNNTTLSLVRSFQIIRDAIMPPLQEIADKILDKLIPAMGEFIRAVEPVATMFRDTLAPVVARTMDILLQVISGVIDILTGAFQVFTGLLTMNWSKTWEGLTNIASGSGQILVEIFRTFGGDIVVLMWNKGQQLWREFTGFINQLRNDTTNIFADLTWRTINSVTGLVTGALGKGFELWQGFTGHIGRLRDNTVGTIDDMRNRVIGGLNALGAGFQNTVNWIGDQWNRLRDLVRHPINGVIDIWNNVNNLWGGADLAHFAGGGRVPGSGSGDIVPAMLTPGEFVIRKGIAEPTRRFLEALNAGQPEAVQATGGAGARMQQFAAGGMVAKAQGWAQAQHGKPYIWGGVGPLGYDCSGFMSAITNVLRGRNPHSRLGVARSQPWAGFRSGMGSAFSTGFSDGHTAGTLGGVNVESGGSPSKTKYAIQAVGADHRQFPGHAFLPEVGGVFASGGAGGGIGGFFAGLAESAIRAALLPINGLIDKLPTGPSMIDRLPRDMASKIRDLITAKALTFVGYGSSGSGPAGNVIASGPAIDQVKAVAARFGWNQGAEWDALHALIQKESGWNPSAANPSSSARGLFQKMTSIHGPVEPTAGGQAEWGLNYIKGRYGSPSAAWAFHRGHNYYDAGGMLPPGLSAASNSSGRPERILSASQTESFERLVAALERGSSGEVTVNVLQTSGSPAETGRFVSLALRTVG